MKQLFILTTFLLLNWTSSIAQVNTANAINLSDPDAISFLAPKDYTIGGVTVSGAKYLDSDVLITISKLVIGQDILVPSEQTSNVIKDLMAQNLFESVELWATRINGETIYFDIRVKERPRLSRIDVHGLSKSQTTEVNKRLNSNSGKIVNDNLIQSTQSTIKKFLREKSYMYPDIKISTKKDSNQTNNEVVIVDVNKNKKIKVDQVIFEGNEVFSNSELTKYLKGVKPKKWYRIFGPGKFKDDKYTEAQEKLIAKLQDKGYRDAQILSDSVYRYGDNKVRIKLDIYEGPKYYVGNIDWVGNTRYKDSILNIILGIEKGDVYSEEKLHTKLMGPTRNSDDISSLYQNDGYLTFNINPIIKKIYNDTIDIEIQISEGKQYTINNS